MVEVDVEVTRPMNRVSPRRARRGCAPRVHGVRLCERQRGARGSTERLEHLQHHPRRQPSACSKTRPAGEAVTEEARQRCPQLHRLPGLDSGRAIPRPSRRPRPSPSLLLPTVGRVLVGLEQHGYVELRSAGRFDPARSGRSGSLDQPSRVQLHAHGVAVCGEVFGFGQRVDVRRDLSECSLLFSFVCRCAARGAGDGVRSPGPRARRGRCSRSTRRATLPSRVLRCSLRSAPSARASARVSFTADMTFKAGVFVGDASATIAITVRARDAAAGPA